MKETGIVFGTFAPLHRGHIDLIVKTKRKCKNVHVVVSGFEGDRGEEVGLDLQKRFRYIREFFAKDELVSVHKLDETGMPAYPNGWDVWLDKLMKLVGNPKCPHFSVSEQEYAEELGKRGHQVELSKRNFGISGTKIRQNPLFYWNYIAQSFKRSFTKKVLILGSASNGKTTLANDLGKFFSAPVSLEYARKYQIENNVEDNELTPKDYFHLLLGQFQQTSKLIDGDSNNGLVIADTNATVTKAYFDYYNEEKDSSDVDTFNHLYKSLVSKEEWDLILFVNPTGDYVDDGFRDTTMGTEEIRNSFSEHMYKRLQEDVLDKNRNIPFIRLSGNYFSNYTKAVAAITKLIEPGGQEKNEE